MADRGDRGGRGGRGRGGGGGGGGGRGRGETRGGRGDSRGGRGDFRGGRGDSRGGRGGGRGDFDGGRGGRGGRGGGGGRGRGGGEFRGGFGGRGRGGGSGRRGGASHQNPQPNLEVFSYEGSVPRPDSNVTQLEQQIVQRSASSMQQLVGQMSKLKVKPGKSGPKVQTATLQDQFPPRPAYGTNGTPVILWANYFRIVTKLKVLYKYTMDVAEVKDKTEEKGKGKSQPRDVKGRKLYFVIRAVLAELTKDKSLVVATEFKSQLVSLQPIEFPQNPMELSIPAQSNPERFETFKVTFHGPTEARVDEMMKYLGGSPETDSGDNTFPRYPEVVDALNVIFGHGPRTRVGDVSPVGSSRFYLVNDSANPHKVEYWNLDQKGRALQAIRGYFQSTRLSTNRLLLNVNVTHGVFKLSGKMDKLFTAFDIKEVERNDYRSMKHIRTFSKFLPKTRVWADMQLSDGKKIKRQKTIQGLARASEIRRPRGGGQAPRFSGNLEFAGPRNVSFFLEQEGKEGRWITVFDYYKQKYGVTLEARYPLVNLGTPDKPTFFPAEFVEIQPGQAAKVKLLGEETTDMLNFACRGPFANAFSITNDGRDSLGLDDGSLDRFGLAVDKTLLTVQGRILPVPSIAYLKSTVAPKAGSWNMMKVKVFKPGARIQRWSYVNLTDYNPVALDTVTRFSQFMIGMGINIEATPQQSPTQAIGTNAAMGADLDRFFKWAQDSQIRFLLVILSRRDTDIYNRVKTLGDCVYGIHTSCVLGDYKKFGGGSPGYFANVALKWNLKAGGVNHRLSQDLELVKQGKTMVVGYDVTHPTNMASGSDNIPSLVGLVSTIDRDMGQWPSVSWEQSSKQEMLDQRLTDEFVSRLQLWQKHNKQQLPENIVIFRDGVSEGQFAQVLEKELPLIRAAFQAKYKGAPPRVTIVVSVKRHQTRFYPTSESDIPAAQRHKNIQNGTVVDRGVTHARVWDFFLTAHAAIKGTARPAHYTVLLDEIFRARYSAEATNELEKFTHQMCYLFGRATKAVSICPPAYYADIVCTRARAHRPEYNEPSDTESVATSQSVGGVAKQVHPNLQDSMYYI